jgi:hypothetical protein
MTTFIYKEANLNKIQQKNENEAWKVSMISYKKIDYIIRLLFLISTAPKR